MPSDEAGHHFLDGLMSVESALVNAIGTVDVLQHDRAAYAVQKPDRRPMPPDDLAQRATSSLR